VWNGYKAKSYSYGSMSLNHLFLDASDPRKHSVSVLHRGSAVGNVHIGEHLWSMTEQDQNGRWPSEPCRHDADINELKKCASVYIVFNSKKQSYPVKSGNSIMYGELGSEWGSTERAECKETKGWNNKYYAYLCDRTKVWTSYLKLYSRKSDVSVSPSLPNLQTQWYLTACA
jgi:hypothetical protein